MNDIMQDIISIIVQIALIPIGLALAPYMERVFLALIEAFTPVENEYTLYQKRSRHKKRTFTSDPSERSYPPVDRNALMKQGIVRPDPQHIKHSR